MGSEEGEDEMNVVDALCYDWGHWERRKRSYSYTPRGSDANIIPTMPGPTGLGVSKESMPIGTIHTGADGHLWKLCIDYKGERRWIRVENEACYLDIESDDSDCVIEDEKVPSSEERETKGLFWRLSSLRPKK